jgi:hypothetical protein
MSVPKPVDAEKVLIDGESWKSYCRSTGKLPALVTKNTRPILGSCRRTVCYLKAMMPRRFIRY